MASGNAISRAPPGSALVYATSLKAVALGGEDAETSPGVVYDDVPVIAALDTIRSVSSAAPFLKILKHF